MGTFFGVPVYLDHEFVELVYLYVADKDDQEDEPYARTAWLIRLEHIVAVGYPLDSWSNERFEQMLKPEECSSEEQQRPDSH